jgi:hypothetical protein
MHLAEDRDRSHQAGSVLVGIGGVLLAVSPYVQWVSVIGLVNINLSQLLILAGY